MIRELLVSWDFSLKEFVAANCFFGGHAAESVIQLSCAFCYVSRHICRKQSEKSELFLAAREGPERLGLLGHEFHAAIGVEDFNEPYVHLARGKAFHFETDRGFRCFRFSLGRAASRGRRRTW